MTTSTTSLARKQRKPRPKPARSIRILEHPSADTDGWAAINITIGKQSQLYRLHTIPTDFGNGAIGFEIEKLDTDFETTAKYHVHLSDKPEECTCDCKGHSRHGHCKHREGVAKLLELGKLSAYRSAGDMAANDPEAFRQHENDTASLNTPRAKDRYVASELAAMEAEFA